MLLKLRLSFAVFEAFNRKTSNYYSEVYYVIKIAFETAEHSNGDEADLVEALRNSKTAYFAAKKTE